MLNGFQAYRILLCFLFSFVFFFLFFFFHNGRSSWCKDFCSVNVVMVISILPKTFLHFLQGQLVLKFLWPSDPDKIVFKAIEEYSVWSPKNCIETPFKFDK